MISFIFFQNNAFNRITVDERYILEHPILYGTVNWNNYHRRGRTSWQAIISLNTTLRIENKALEKTCITTVEGTTKASDAKKLVKHGQHFLVFRLHIISSFNTILTVLEGRTEKCCPRSQVKTERARSLRVT